MTQRRPLPTLCSRARNWMHSNFTDLGFIWAYLILLSAQVVYIALYPDFTSLSFLGIMLTGNTMSVGQLLSALFGFDGKGGFDTRIQGIYSTHAGPQRYGASLAACVSV